jgi:hypothetical protein
VLPDITDVKFVCSAEDMQKLHKAHLNVLKVDTNPSTLSLNVVAAAAPPVPNRAKKGSKHSSHLSGAESPYPSESGVSEPDFASTQSVNGDADSFTTSPATYNPDTEIPKRSLFGLGKRRKPPAVPDRKAKPSTSHLREDSANGTARSQQHPAWSPAFEVEDPIPQQPEEKKEKHGLGFNALAQALQEAGSRRRSTARRRSVDEIQKRDASESRRQNSNTPSIVVDSADAEEGEQRRSDGRWYQATGWTTFA